MKAMIVHRPEAARHDVYFYVEHGDRRVPLVMDKHPHRSRLVLSDLEAPPFAELPFAFSLDEVQLDALRRALIGEAIAHDDALADTRKVRDRLLALVETQVIRSLSGTAHVTFPPMPSSPGAP